MADQLVETKLLLPRVRRGFVPRPRLAERLAGAWDAALTLVSAPPGFGKTTLIATGLTDAAATSTGSAGRVAWVSLDERDRSAASFWAYVLGALDRAVPGSATSALTVLLSGQAPIEAVLASVVNELSVQDGDVTLVLDDYHLADGPEVAVGMAFLLDHLPPQVHLVISTRADPMLPISRLRARGELVEIRAADLRFTRAEVSSYLNDANGLDLADAEVAALEARTEGWVAALQLAALSLRDRPDAETFVAQFAGNDRFVVDYLADEVLTRQPDRVRRFLLDTSVLERLTGPLCDAVVGSTGPAGRAVLEELERQNLFLIPLDDRRGWYRYHHLFADVLRSHLADERPDDVPLLHRRASRWYAEHGQVEPAVRHALAGGDVDSAADLVESAIPDLTRRRREAVIRRWIDDLPADITRDRPVLGLGFVGALMASNEFDGVDARLVELDAQLARPASELVVVDRDALARIPAASEMYRAALALIEGDLSGTIAHAARADELAPPGDDLVTSAAAALAGLAHWAEGDIVAAHREYVASAAGLARAGHVADVLGCSLTIADMELALGRLADSERTLGRALELAGSDGPGGGPAGTAGPGVLRGTADMLVGLSRAAWHRNDLAAAADLLARADDLGEAAGLPQYPYRWRVAMARLRAADRDWVGALELVDEAQRVYIGDYQPDVHPLHATRARILVAAGDLPAARAWAHQHGVRPDDDLSYLREYEHLTLARLLLAEHESGGAAGHESLRAATDLLDRLLVAARAGNRAGTVIEVEILRVRALHAAGEEQQALAALGHAVELAEPDGWVRVLVDAGPRTVAVLQALERTRPGSGFVRQLLAELADPSPAGETRSEERRPALVDPLSEREVDVLRLLASDLDGPAIARELVVSLNTVRTHTKHIYAKLGVSNRRTAVSRAHQLGLLSRARS